MFGQVMTDDSGKCRGFGFVGFEDHESAQKVRWCFGLHCFWVLSTQLSLAPWSNSRLDLSVELGRD